jgi:hypothetical protein
MKRDRLTEICPCGPVLICAPCHISWLLHATRCRICRSAIGFIPAAVNLLVAQPASVPQAQMLISRAEIADLAQFGEDVLEGVSWPFPSQGHVEIGDRRFGNSMSFEEDYTEALEEEYRESYRENQAMYELQLARMQQPTDTVNEHPSRIRLIHDGDAEAQPEHDCSDAQDDSPGIVDEDNVGRFSIT